MLDKDYDWFETDFVLAVDTSSSEPVKYYLIYKYEVYDVEYLTREGLRNRNVMSHQSFVTDLTLLLSQFWRCRGSRKHSG